MTFAIARVTPYDEAKLAEVDQQWDEFQRLHASQPGYSATVVVDIGDGRRLSMTMWETEQHAHAARRVLEPEAGRLLGPLMSGTSQVVGAGHVVADDLR